MSGGPRRRHLVTGLVLIVCSVAAICGGALAAIASSSRMYVDLGAHGSYRTARYGLATESTNWRSQFLGWADSARVEVASATGKPIFVGVAAADDIGRYLAGAGYTTVDGHDRTDHDGAAPTDPPAGAIDWTAETTGTGTQTLRWRATDRPQIVFAMNADRSRPVRVQVISSAVTLERMPWWIPAGALTVGVLLLPPGALLLRRRKESRAA
jgi:hypothetical protein